MRARSHPRVRATRLAANISHLTGLVGPKGVTVLEPTPAVDTNAFAVTRATARRYSLVKTSDPAP